MKYQMNTIITILHIAYISHESDIKIDGRARVIDDYAKDGSEELFTKMRCVRITNLQRYLSYERNFVKFQLSDFR